MKKSLNSIGSGLALLGCGYVIYNIYKYSGQIDLFSIDLYGWLVISGLIIFYGAASILLALAWRQLLIRLEVRVSRRFAVYVYAVSQLAKYLPGNIFHLAGRQVIGVAEGLPGWVLVKSMVWEIVFISITGSLFAILILPLIIPEFNFYFGGIAFIFTIIFIFWVTKRFFSKELSYTIINYVVYLAYSGFMFVAVLTLVTPFGNLAPPLLLPIVGTYVIAWLAGFVTPGAPAGIGVRELVLLAMLQQYIDKADLLTATLVGRMVTIGGDLIFYLIAMMLFKGEVFLPEK